MNEGNDRPEASFLPLPLPRQFSHEGRRGSLGKISTKKKLQRKFFKNYQTSRKKLQVADFRYLFEISVISKIRKNERNFVALARRNKMKLKLCLSEPGILTTSS